ncbi:putative inorganic phosphate cotransporter isoform X3 [Scylla paramamosain]
MSACDALMIVADNTVSVPATLPASLLTPDVNHKQPPEEKKADPRALRRKCWGARHSVAFLALCCVILDFMMQTILSVTIVAMVGRRGVSQQETEDACPLPDGQNTTEVMEPGEFDWDEKMQGLLQGAMNFGCAIMSLPNGRIVEVYGGKRMLGVMLACASVMSLLSPVAARMSIWVLIGLRVLQGVCLVGVLPALNTVIVAWFPPEERAKFFAIILTGLNVGTVTSMVLAGWLCELEWLGGWPAPFYVVGAAGLLWSVLWHALIYQTPEVHPRISKEEMLYILGGGRRAKEDQKRKFPWAKFLRSPLVWVQTATCMGDVFSLYIILTMVPTYLTNIQHFDLRNAGIVAALPYLLSCPVSVCWGLLVGYLTASRVLTKRRIKQLSTVVGFYVPTLCMVGICLAGCSKDVVVVLLILSVCANSCNFAGIFTTYQDLSPTFCATFMGFTGMFSSITGMVGPVVTGLMINDSQTLGAWRNVFITSAVIYFASCTLYLAVTPMRQQQWDSPTPPTPCPRPCMFPSPDPAPARKSQEC